MLKAKRILIAAGGTGGHINPALSVAGYIYCTVSGIRLQDALLISRGLKKNRT